MKPQIVQEVREQTSQKDEIGKVVHAVEPIVLNKVDMKEEYIKQVKEGFRKVFQEGDGTGVRAFQKHLINQQVKQEQHRQYTVEKVILEEMKRAREENVIT